MAPSRCALSAAVVLTAALGAPAIAAPQTVCATRGADGTFLGGFDAALSPDGRYVAFRSRFAGYLAGPGPNSEQIYLRDLRSGAPRLMSISTTGGYGNADSFSPTVSADGVRVLFGSAASNLVSGDTNQMTDVFARNPGTNTTFRISRSTSNVQGNYDSEPGDLTPDGNLIVFYSGASTFAPPDLSYDDIYLRDSVNFTTTRVSVSLSGGEPNSNSRDPAISDDGRYVAFWSVATDIVANDTAGNGIFVRDRVDNTTRRVSTAADGTPANELVYHPCISGNGRYVSFESGSTNLVAADLKGTLQCFIKDLATGAIELAAQPPGGAPPNGQTSGARLSADGRYVAFVSEATNLIPGLSPAGSHVYVRDRQNGQTVLASVAWDGSVPNGLNSGVSLSDDGQTVAFASVNALLPADTDNLVDVYIRGPLWDVAVPFTLADSASALRIASGIAAAQPADLARLNVETGGASGPAVDIGDSLRIARKAAGLEANP